MLLMQIPEHNSLILHIFVFYLMNQKPPSQSSSTQDSGLVLTALKCSRANPEFEQLSYLKEPLSEPPTQTNVSTPQLLRGSLSQGLHQLFGNSFPLLIDLFNKWIDDDWKDIRKGVNNRLVKLRYLTPTLKFEPYPTIQKEIRLEWRKNPVLSGLVLLWGHVLRNLSFNHNQHLAEFFLGFCQIVRQTSYRLFTHCWERHKNWRALQMKLHITSVAVITDSREWNQWYERYLVPILQTQAVVFSDDFDLNDLDINPRILNLNQPAFSFPKTAHSLRELRMQSSIRGIERGLKVFRQILLEEISLSIEKHKMGEDKKPLTVEKEDVLTCIIFVMVRHKLDSMGVLVEHLQMLLGQDLFEVLRWYKVDSFYADLYAAYEYVRSNHQKQRRSQTSKKLKT